MAEAGAGPSETVTETTVTVTTEPVRKAGRGACLGVWEVLGGKWSFGEFGIWDMWGLTFVGKFARD